MERLGPARDVRVVYEQLLRVAACTPTRVRRVRSKASRRRNRTPGRGVGGITWWRARCQSRGWGRTTSPRRSPCSTDPPPSLSNCLLGRASWAAQRPLSSVRGPAALQSVGHGKAALCAPLVHYLPSPSSKRASQARPSSRWTPVLPRATRGGKVVFQHPRRRMCRPCGAPRRPATANAACSNTPHAWRGRRLGGTTRPTWEL
jgi:hypothetical protein